MSKENEENESEINEIEYLSISKEIIEDNDIMQIDKERLNKEVIEGLRLLHLKSLYNFTEAAYNDIIKLFANKNISLYKVKKILEEFTGLVPTFYVIQMFMKVIKIAHYVIHQGMIQTINQRKSYLIFLLKKC